MAQVKYKSYFDIDSEFTKVVRESNFISQPDRWLNFYPHDKFVKLLTDIERVISRTEKGVSVWVEGAYGTGKTYAVLTLKKILDTDSEKVEEYFTRYGLSNDLFAKYKNIKKEPILTAYRSGSSDISSTRDLIVALQESILAVTKEKGLKGGEKSLKEAGIKWLSDPDKKTLFQALIRKDERNRLNNKTVDSIIEELKNPKDDKSVIELIRKCDELGKENDIYVFRPEAKEFAEWVKCIIKENNISAFVFIWDEFTEFFQNNLQKLTDFQDHIIGLSDNGFFFIPITHVSGALFYDDNSKNSDKRKIFDRFVKPTIRIELPDSIGFKLIAAALKRNDAKKRDWEQIATEMDSNITEARQKVGVEVNLADETIKNILPLHPYAGLVLKYLAEKFQSNQRSMLDFIVSDLGDIKAFQWFIENHGPFDDKKYMTIDYLWDFFYEKGRNDLPLEVRKILDAYNRANAKQLTEDELTVFKTILIMIATSRSVNDEKEILKPNEQNLALAFLGTDLSEMSAINIAKKLVTQHVLYEKDIVGGKKIYLVAIESIDKSEIQEIVEQIKNKKTAELAAEAEIANIMTANPPLKPSLKKRFEFFVVTVDDIQRRTNEIINRADYDTKSKNKIPVFLCVARDDREHSALYKKIKDCNMQEIPNAGNPIVFIDLAKNSMSETSWNAYLENKARAQYLSSKNGNESEQAKELAEIELKSWRKVIAQSKFELWFAPLYKDGEIVHDLNDLAGIFEAINKNLYRCAPETWCDVIDNLYTDGLIAQGVLFGAKEEVGGTYKNAQKPIEKAIGFAWQNPQYWEQNANAPISKIKIFVDKKIAEDIKNFTQAGIGDLYNMLQDRPYGFTNCNLCAFLLGFVLKEYAQSAGEYYYSDGNVDEILTYERIRDIGKEVIQNAISSSTRIKEKYIKAKSEEEKKFSESTAKIFELNVQACFVGKIRDQLRTKLRSYTFPIWALKELSDDKTIHDLIDKYLGVVNTQNYENGKKNETEIIKTIGAEFLAQPTLTDTLKKLITKENCCEGIKKYLSIYKSGILPDLCTKLNFGEQYLETLKRKFEVEASTWVWNKQTADMLIDSEIYEYQVIEQSKIFGVKPEKPSDINEVYRSFLGDIKISYDAAKPYIKGGELFELLVKVKQFTDISDYSAFLELLKTQGAEFNTFLKEQKDIFKKIIDIWAHDLLSDEQINEVYIRIGEGHFDSDKYAYKTMVQNEVEEYIASLNREKLRKFWKDRTGTETPRKWSEKYTTPVLALVPKDEIIDAKRYFGVVNNPNPDNAEAEKALIYLKSIKWWDALSSPDKRDNAFANCIINEYSVILTVDRVRDLLVKHLTERVYDWYSNDQAREKVKELAQSEYDTKSVKDAISIVDRIDDEKVKDYLKRLIRLYMPVGIEIISDNKENKDGS